MRVEVLRAGYDRARRWRARRVLVVRLAASITITAAQVACDAGNSESSYVGFNNINRRFF